jgi:hypothetical protein
MKKTLNMKESKITQLTIQIAQLTTALTARIISQRRLTKDFRERIILYCKGDLDCEGDEKHAHCERCGYVWTLPVLNYECFCENPDAVDQDDIKQDQNDLDLDGGENNLDLDGDENADATKPAPGPIQGYDAAASAGPG